MTLQELAKLANECIASKSQVTLVRKKGHKPPQAFPRGELLCENFSGDHCYSYDPAKIIRWIAKRGEK